MTQALPENLKYSLPSIEEIEKELGKDDEWRNILTMILMPFHQNTFFTPSG
jgi:hypothetical protein